VLVAHRESWYVPPGAVVTFANFALGDQVTFRAYRPGPGNQSRGFLGSACFRTPFFKPPLKFKVIRDVKWTGDRFVEADD
jgi:hypothetical protein